MIPQKVIDSVRRGTDKDLPYLKNAIAAYLERRRLETKALLKRQHAALRHTTVSGD